MLYWICKYKPLFPMRWFYYVSPSQWINFKMILWEMRQISYCENIQTDFFTED
jgi:hypothetical protein